MKKFLAIIFASTACLLAFAGCNSKPADSTADNAKAAADAGSADSTKTDDAKANDAKPEEAKAEDAAPSLEDVCKHTASCFEDSNVEQCVAMAKNDDSATKCPKEFNAMQKCMVAASCDDIKANKACNAENEALLACKGNSAKD